MKSLLSRALSQFRRWNLLAILALLSKSWPGQVQFLVSNLASSSTFDSRVVRKELQLEMLSKEIKEAWLWGRWHSFTSKSAELLSEAYAMYDVDPDAHGPNVYSTEWASNIGHLGFLGAHQAAQKLGLVKSRKMSMSLTRGGQDQKARIMFGSRLGSLNFDRNFGDTLLYRNWVNYEQLGVVWHKNLGPVSTFQLVDEVFALSKPSISEPLFELPENYIEHSRQQLRTLGLSDSDWFVGLHVRNDSTINGRRNQSFENFLPLIMEVIRRGGKVLRIGDSGMEMAPEIEGFYDLAVGPLANPSLHLYALARGTCFVGTQSGPTSIPPLYGVPTLTTNVCSPGKNTPANSEHSIFVPKHVFSTSGERLSFSQILQSPEGYGELDLSQLKAVGLRLEENSSTEILEAGKEILDRIEKRKVGVTPTVPGIDKVRASHSDFTSSGKISQSFVETWPNWEH